VFIIETKGRSLEETAALFDGEEALEQIAGARNDVHEDGDEKGSTSGRYSPQQLPKV
jgi:hypothetical protein